MWGGISFASCIYKAKVKVDTRQIVYIRSRKSPQKGRHNNCKALFRIERDAIAQYYLSTSWNKEKVIGKNQKLSGKHLKSVYAGN